MTPNLPLQQHPFYAAALARLGREMRRIDLPGGRALALCRRLPLGRELRLAARGPVWDEGVTAGDQVEGLAASRLGLIEAESPALAPVLRAAGFRQVMTGLHVAEMDLRGTREDRRARAEAKWRAALRRAESGPVQVAEEVFDPARHGWFLAETAEVRRQRGYHALPAAVTLAYAAANPGQARLFLARLGRKGDPLAAMLFLTHPPTATYHLGWTSAAGRAVLAHHLILMRAADSLAARGHLRLDLGSLETETAAGLARFKLGSGAVARELGGSWLRLPFARRRLAA